MLRLRISLSCSLVLATSAHAGELVVRGTPLSWPFDLRVLVQEVPKGKVLEISGTRLRDDRGASTGDENLRCTVRQNPAAFLPTLLTVPGDQHEGWMCQGNNYQRLINRPVRYQAGAGYVRVGTELYRAGVELVPQDGKLLVINTIGMDHYLAGLVNGEIRSDYPPEAVKAQIIAARSYALATAADRRRAGMAFDLYGTIQDQVYRGAQDEDAASVRLVRETAGDILTHQGDVLKAYYHASSGGYSELPQYVWTDGDSTKDSLAYLARASDIDENLPGTRWNITLSPQMGLQWPGIGRIFEFAVQGRSPGQRVQNVLLRGSDGEQNMTGSEFRRRLGANWVKSTYFFVKRVGQGWLLEGRGYGHGVGLSQLGARALAKSGKNSEEILRHYYPYANVQKLPLDEGTAPAPIGTR